MKKSLKNLDITLESFLKKSLRAVNLYNQMAGFLFLFLPVYIIVSMIAALFYAERNLLIYLMSFLGLFTIIIPVILLNKNLIFKALKRSYNVIKFEPYIITEMKTEQFNVSDDFYPECYTIAEFYSKIAWPQAEAYYIDVVILTDRFGNRCKYIINVLGSVNLSDDLKAFPFLKKGYATHWFFTKFIDSTGKVTMVSLFLLLSLTLIFSLFFPYLLFALGAILVLVFVIYRSTLYYNRRAARVILPKYGYIKRPKR